LSTTFGYLLKQHVSGDEEKVVQCRWTTGRCANIGIIPLCFKNPELMAWIGLTEDDLPRVLLHHQIHRQ
jgi:hypothetical protein